MLPAAAAVREGPVITPRLDKRIALSRAPALCGAVPTMPQQQVGTPVRRHRLQACLYVRHARSRARGRFVAGVAAFRL